jgi:hypothetical protein
MMQITFGPSVVYLRIHFKIMYVINHKQGGTW